MIDLELPRRFNPILEQARLVARSLFRPISRKYDRLEHTYPKELDVLGALISGLDSAGVSESARASKPAPGEVRNGGNMATVLGTIELCWGDIGLLLSIPRQGLGNAAIAAVGTDAQKHRWKNVWAAMAITEPGAGSDSAAIQTSARADGDHWVLDGEKIYVTAGSRADAVVVWATVDPSLGRAGIKSFFVPHGTPGMKVLRLDHKLGIRASDTAVIVFDECRIPRDHILGDQEKKIGHEVADDVRAERSSRTRSVRESVGGTREAMPRGGEGSEEPSRKKTGFGGVMETFDNTRPVVAAMALGVARAALERTRELLERPRLPVTPRWEQSALDAELNRLEAELEAARLMTLKAAWMADNAQPNSMHASMAKAKAGRVGNEITLRCVELCGQLGYSEEELLEKWARDSKILDIFEGTQQIQLLIVARRLLGLKSSQLR